MKKIEIIHDGVSKKVYATDEPDKVIIQYTDAITAYYKIKRALIKDKGVRAALECVSGIVADSALAADIEKEYLRLQKQYVICSYSKVK